MENKTIRIALTTKEDEDKRRKSLDDKKEVEENIDKMTKKQMFSFEFTKKKTNRKMISSLIFIVKFQIEVELSFWKSFR